MSPRFPSIGFLACEPMERFSPSPRTPITKITSEPSMLALSLRSPRHSGQWLLNRFGVEAAANLAVVRRADVKFRRPATGKLTAQADVAPDEAERFLDTLSRRGRASIEVRVRLLDAEGSVTLEASIEWFAQQIRG